MVLRPDWFRVVKKNVIRLEVSVKCCGVGDHRLQHGLAQVQVGNLADPVVRSGDGPGNLRVYLGPPSLLCCVSYLYVYE